jgi:endonuclease I
LFYIQNSAIFRSNYRKYMKKIFHVIVLWGTLSVLVYGQADSYYSSINPDTSSFISILQTRIRSPYTQISYDQYDETNVANFASRDTVISGTTYGVFTDVYSGENCVYTKPFAWGSTYSREHTWCQSWFPVASSSNQYYSDQHHLFPVQQNHTNVMRSNHPLGIVKTATYTYLEAKLGTDSSGNTVWEPRECHKGDAARALLYMAVRYNGVSGYGDWTFNYLNTTTLPKGSEGSEYIATLLKWNKEDPPDKWEIDRNNYVQSIQQNRNPFVDHPEWVNYINFADLSKISVSYSPEPTQKSSNLVVTKGANSVTVSWAKVSSGTQTPSGYLLEGFRTNTYFLPIDGETYDDKTSWSDSTAIVNVIYGTTSYTFSGVDTSKQFYFMVFPYNGTSTLRNYKTTGLADTLSLLQPIGGESWGAATVQQIVWSSIAISNVKLEYSTNGGTSWTTIIASTPASAGYYNWTVPSTISSNYKIRITDASSSTRTVTSTSAFAVTSSSGASVTLTSPAGGETWYVGSSHTVTWTSANITNIKLEYSTDNGSNWTAIISSTAASTGSYSWTIPSAVSSLCLVRTSDASNSSTSSVNASTFSIAAAPSLSITSPVGGESWVGGSSHNITWTAVNVTNVKLEYTTDAGTNWATITASTAASSGTYSWTVPNTASTNFKVRISDLAGNASSTVSAAVFTVTVATSSLTLTSPVGGESWVGGSSHNITWTAVNVTNVKLEYTTDAGSNWSTIIASTAASSGTYSWTVPTTASTNYKVRISDVAGAASSNVSAAVFTVTTTAGTLTLTSPVGGESWTGGSAHNITWTSSNITNIRIEYTSDGGTNWVTVIASTAASANSYAWTVPSTASTNYKIRLTDASNSSVTSVSNAVFTVTVANNVSLTSPIGGESWTVSTSHNITWTSSNLTNVMLEYSTDSGTNWITIIASTTAGTASYAWTVPNTVSTNCKVRISDASNSSVNSVSASVFTITSSYVSPYNLSAGVTYLQNFDSLGTVATATLPYGWKVAKNTATLQTVGAYSNAVSATAYTGGNSLSSTAAGGIYNFGAGVANSATDRALGGLSSSSSSKNVNMFLALKNNSSSPIYGLTISYKVEKYRMGTNPAGFTMQLFYSTTGDSTSWTSAGTDFKTSFAADASTAGYSSAPGDSASIVNKTITYTIAAGASFYLAWNYSVTSGTTTTFSQALGIDNVYVTARGVDLLPVELTTFDASTKNNNVVLDWNTATEQNTADFEVQRANSNSNWRTVAVVPAFGNSNAPRDYGYVDKNLPEGNYVYRLRIVDNDGSFIYSPEVCATIASSVDYVLLQNYPNPFNPSTVIGFSVPSPSNVKLELYTTVGEKVAELVNRTVEGGYFSCQLNMNSYGLTTGTYFYSLSGTENATGKTFHAVKKLVYIK